MAGITSLVRRTVSRVTLAEGLTLLLLVFSIILFRARGISYGYLFTDAAVGVARLAFLFLPVMILKLALDFTHVSSGRRRVLYTAYFTGMLALFLFSPLFGYLPRPDEVKRLSTLFIFASPMALAVYLVLWKRAFTRDRQGHRSTSRDHLQTLSTTARALALLILCYVVHSNLKAALPLFRVYSWDGAALNLDTLMFLGHNPYLVLHRVLPPDTWTLFFEQFYFFFFYFNAFGLSGAFVFGSAGYLFRVTNTVVMAYHIGLAFYWLFPTLGPCFYKETAYIFNRLPETMALKPMLYDRFTRLVMSPAGFKPGLFDGIAAFPSLHVTHSLIYLVYLWPRHRGMTLLNIAPFFLLCLSTVYLGWHYVLDIPGGALVALMALILVHRTFKDEARFL